MISELQGFTSIRREVKVGDSTIDFELLWQEGGKTIKKVLVEVKSVTLAETIKINDSTDAELRAVFPDCVSERASRHAQCLTTQMLKHEKKDEELQTVKLCVK